MKKTVWYEIDEFTSNLVVPGGMVIKDAAGFMVFVPCNDLEKIIEWEEEMEKVLASFDPQHSQSNPRDARGNNVGSDPEVLSDVDRKFRAATAPGNRT